MSNENLLSQRCVPCEGGTEAITKAAAKTLLQQIDYRWEINDDGTEIQRTFKFKGFLRTMSFVNAVAWIANHENHHPDLLVGYNYCTVRYTTHAIGGLSENDFICAAKIDALNP